MFETHHHISIWTTTIKQQTSGITHRQAGTKNAVREIKGRKEDREETASG